MDSPKELAEWTELQMHWQEMSSVHMRDLFAVDDQRFDRYSLEACGLLFDYSKNIINSKTLDLLTSLADRRGLATKIQQMFSGEPINFTEQRPALHIALRNRTDYPIAVNGKDVMPDVDRVLQQMRIFTEAVRSGEWLGYSGKRITDVVNIGIGGSHLGPMMVTKALKPYHHPDLGFHFVSNIDGTHLTETLKKLNPETTLFIVSSKSFTTQETLSNAHAARRWLLSGIKDGGQVARHFVAVSANSKKVAAFGINPDNMFSIWDWVGGRYSVWSAIGLPIAIAIGMDQFVEFLNGAREMDQHFRTADFSQNMPVIMAMLGVWYNNFASINNHAIMPYDQYLRLLPDYLQQTDMESNGKGKHANGDDVTISTGPIIWGSVGADAQHAYFQLFHQGRQSTTCDFIVPVRSHNELGDHHQKLLANCLAQTEALLMGRSAHQVQHEMRLAGYPGDEIKRLLPHRTFSGNRPSNTILMEQITPATLGSLIALYEHKIFVQGVIWGINSFDQWGVELGKELAGVILAEMKGQSSEASHDCSTMNLVRYCQLVRGDTKPAAMKLDKPLTGYKMTGSQHSTGPTLE
ncbi:MAG: glucose-6-phosphate isomerase [Sedimenticola sp.]|nr:glucose-6-phosphate isomerase [Sedimenticola sp.]